jgi:hypothetical protein
VVVPKSDGDIDALVLAAYAAGETNYVPVAMKDKLIGWTSLASPGESVEMSFVVPAAGEVHLRLPVSRSLELDAGHPFER